MRPALRSDAWRRSGTSGWGRPGTGSLPLGAPRQRACRCAAAAEAPAAAAPDDTDLGANGAHSLRGTARVFKASLDAMLLGYLGASPRAVAAIERLLPGAAGYEGAPPELPLDHVAFRTFGAPGLGNDAMGAALASFGYRRQPGSVALDGGRVTATWFAPPQAGGRALPRVCVSQLELDALSAPARGAALRYAAPLAAAFQPTAAWAAAVTRALPWGPVDLEDFCLLGGESEYASWVLTNGYALTHVALSFPEEGGGLEAALGRLRSRGFALNEARASDAVPAASDAAAIASDDGMLRQAATVADLQEFWFGGEAEPRLVPGSYLKLVERRREGFDAAAADVFLRSTALAAEEAAAAAAAEG